ncbi:MAG: glycosyltransferase family 39 protein [Candidatus Omnitrophica bacterium]|nr:glycosyltransferase family 39 protein [Candidatus Omnitrophota bacterium]
MIVDSRFRRGDKRMLSVILYEHRFAIALLAFAAFLVFNYLDNQVIWQDEAETAMLAKSVLQYGYPNGYYGDYVISPVNLSYKDYGPGGAWLYATWIPYYLTAFSFYLFGATTWAARFPHALAGFVSFILTYVLALRLFRNKNVAVLTLAVMVVSVPTLLLFRQCRYYSFQTMFVLLTYLAHFQLLNGFSKRKAAAFLLSLLALFHTTQGMFIPFFAWVVFDFFIFKRHLPWRAADKKFLLVGSLITLSLIVPWYFFLITYQNAARLNVLELWRNFEFSVRMVNKFIFPLGVNSVLLGWIYLKQRQHGEKIVLERWVVPVISFIFINSIFFVFLRHRMLRYFIHLFPFYFMIQAWIFWHLARYARVWFVAAIFSIVCLTNLFSSSGAKLFSSLNLKENVLEFKESFRAYLPLFLYEITHRYGGPVSSAVEYLKQHAKPGETIKVPMGGDADSFQFYLPEQFVINELFFAKNDFPDWIVPRDYWVRQELRLSKPEDLAQKEDYLNEIGRRYERITLPTFDIVWENRPDDLGYHKFRTVTEGLYPTMIYKKLSNEDYARKMKDFQQEQVQGRGFDRKPLIPVLYLPLK